MKHVACLALGLAMTGAAFAQPDPLCDSLDAIIAAGRQAETFVSLAPGMSAKAFTAPAEKPAGFEGEWTCKVNLAATPARGAHPSTRARYNEFTCQQLMPAGEGRTIEDIVGAADVAYVTFSGRVHACISKTGWSPLDEQDVDEAEDIYLRTPWLNPAVKGGFISELHIPKLTEEEPASSLTSYLNFFFRVPLPS